MRREDIHDLEPGDFGYHASRESERTYTQSELDAALANRGQRVQTATVEAAAKHIPTVWPDPGELLGLVALPSEVEHAPKQLSGSANDLIRSVASVIDEMRKISDLAQQIEKTPVVDGTLEKDREMAKKFAIHALWARFHVDCLVKSMSAKIPIFPEVTSQMVDGLRAVVDAYAWIRQGVDLRSVTPDLELPPIQWEAEDEAFLSDSMRELDQKG